MAWEVRQVASIKGLPLPCWHCDQYLKRPFPFDPLYPSRLTVFLFFLFLPLKADGAIGEALVHGLASSLIIISPLVALGKKAPQSSAVVARQPAVNSCGGVSKGLWATGDRFVYYTVELYIVVRKIFVEYRSCKHFGSQLKPL